MKQKTINVTCLIFFSFFQVHQNKVIRHTTTLIHHLSENCDEEKSKKILPYFHVDVGSSQEGDLML